ncbi:hypothetical protein, partial [Stenotrophomonas rhizophila]|uniref:hypothetical protein n=1 Tax=Stenotrophomonas rhizophila TaxID=216778 RepID=UPI0028A873A2
MTFEWKRAFVAGHALPDVAPPSAVVWEPTLPARDARRIIVGAEAMDLPLPLLLRVGAVPKRLPTRGGGALLGRMTYEWKRAFVSGHALPDVAPPSAVVWEPT